MRFECSIGHDVVPVQYPVLRTFESIAVGILEVVNANDNLVTADPEDGLVGEIIVRVVMCGEAVVPVPIPSGIARGGDCQIYAAFRLVDNGCQKLSTRLVVQYLRVS